MIDPRQMWACAGCGTERQWGYGRAMDERAKPLLVCEGYKACGKGELVPHIFIGLQASGKMYPGVLR